MRVIQEIFELGYQVSFGISWNRDMVYVLGLQVRHGKHSRYRLLRKAGVIFNAI